MRDRAYHIKAHCTWDASTVLSNRVPARGGRLTTFDRLGTAGTFVSSSSTPRILPVGNTLPRIIPLRVGRQGLADPSAEARMTGCRNNGGHALVVDVAWCSHPEEAQTRPTSLRSLPNKENTLYVSFLPMMCLSTKVSNGMTALPQRTCPDDLLRQWRSSGSSLS
jgi:hypothetical protein